MVVASCRGASIPHKRLLFPTDKRRAAGSLLSLSSNLYLNRNAFCASHSIGIPLPGRLLSCAQAKNKLV